MMHANARARMHMAEGGPSLRGVRHCCSKCKPGARTPSQPATSQASGASGNLSAPHGLYYVVCITGSQVTGRGARASARLLPALLILFAV